MNSIEGETGQSMSDRMNRLCDQLRIKLHGIDRQLEALKANGFDIADKSRSRIESQLEFVQRRILDRRKAVEAANSKVDEWIKKKPSAWDSKLAEWKRGRRFLRLNERADEVEDYAFAVFELAIAAADEAAQAALEAVLARGDATNASLPPSTGGSEAMTSAQPPATEVDLA
jgi:hypothetical protein